MSSVRRGRLLFEALADQGHDAYLATEFGEAHVCDCLDLLRAIPNDSIDLCVTSPPYERQPKYGNGEKYERDWFTGFFLDATQELLRVTKPTGQFVLNFRSRRQGVERSTLQYELIGWLREQGWLFAEDHVWVKPSPPPGRFRQALKDQVEYCFRFAKSDAFELYPEQCLMPARWDAKDRERRKKLVHNFVRVNAPGGHGRKRVQAGPDWVHPGNALVTEAEFSANPTKHPARFPPAIPEYFIKLCTRQGGLVLDIFAGTCTTAVVAEALERRWLMCELDQSFVEVLSDRFEDLGRRQETAPTYDGVPEGVRVVPLRGALPAPKVERLPGARKAREVADRVDVEQFGEVAGHEDAPVGGADDGAERVVHATPAKALKDCQDGDTAQAFGFSA